MRSNPINRETKKSIMEKLNLCLPISVLTPRFEMHSNREVIVEGCKSILEYDEDIIKLNTGKLIVTFLGRNLAIKCLTLDSLIVNGFITNIEFTC